MEVMIIRTYKTAQVAAIIGVHPNTVRLYEELGLIPKTKRQANGYRVFTDWHIDVFQIARLAFQIEVLQNGLRKKMVNMIKAAAAGDIETAISMTEEYLQQLQDEQKNAKEAIAIAKQIMAGNSTHQAVKLKRNETAKLLQISMDTLRNWEMNGLLTVKRAENGYRIYNAEDIDRLKIIRSLRCANYSLEAILRMLSVLSSDPNADMERVLDGAEADADIISVCDNLLTSLNLARQNAERIYAKLGEMNNKP